MSGDIPASRRGLVAVAALAAVLLAGALAYLLASWLGAPGAGEVSRLTPEVSGAAAPSPSSAPLTDVARAALSRTVTVEGIANNQEQFGTAWLFDRHGDFVTNAHVVIGDSTIRLRDRTGGTHVAVVIGENDKDDIAVLRSKDGFTGDPLPVAGDDPSAGDHVVVIASSRATGHGDVTVETIRGLHAAAEVERGTVPLGHLSPAYADMIELSGAPVYEGNSGGPVLDDQGEVVGVLTLAAKAGATGYAIPISRVIDEITTMAEAA